MTIELTLPNLVMRWQPSATGNLELVSLQSGATEWIAAPMPVFDHPFTDVTCSRHLDNLTMTGRLGDEGLTATVTWTSYPEFSVAGSTVSIGNASDGPLILHSLPSLRLTTPASSPAQLSVLAGGRWDESMPPRGYRLTTFDLAEYALSRTYGVADDGRSSGEWIPWFALTNSSSGVFAGLVWSGRWQLQSGRDDAGVELSLGIADFEHYLLPGEEIELPGVVISGYEGDLDAGSQQWRNWIRASWTPATPEAWPWVQYNHWYAYYGDIDQDRLYAEAELAAEAGCEVFVIDDGWFIGRRPDSYHSGWGNWVEDRMKFPDGLRAFGTRLGALGLKFGLWVEPERAAIDSPILTAHPDWITRRDGIPATRPESDKGSVHLCFGNPTVQDWAIGAIVSVVRDYGVDWLKWDYNIGYGLGCNVADHGHQAGDGHWANTLGLYRVLAAIREQCPNLMIENCASGGHRVDLGMLRHTHTNWISDYTNRAASCRQHTQGAGLFMPIAHLNSWVLERRGEAEFRSRFGGAFGVSWFLRDWSTQDRTTLRNAISEYKQFRPLLHGNRYLLSGPHHQTWDVWQFSAVEDSAIAILAFRSGGQVEEVRVIPRIGDRDARYSIAIGFDGEGYETDGLDLATRGLNLLIQNPNESLLLTMTKIP